MRAIILLGTIMCVSCSDNQNVQKQPAISLATAMKIAIDEFENENWGKLEEYSVECVPSEDNSVYIIMFEAQSIPIGIPGSNLYVAVDKVSKKTTVFNE